MKIKATIHPNSKHPRVEKNSAGVLHIYVKEPASENKANLACQAALAKYFGTSKSKVALLKGPKSKLKTFEVI